MALWANVRAYLRYRRKAVTKHGVHSPFVFDLITQTLPSKLADATVFSAEKWREECLSNQKAIDVTDFGTGKSGSRTIASIAKRAAKSPKEGRLLYRIVKRFQPKTILELGTSLGISAHYLYAGSPDAKLVTIEGCPQTAAVAREGFHKHQVNAEQYVGEFTDVLPALLEKLQRVDLVYIDGNHKREATLAYFNQIRKYAHNDTVFIFDDIHWSVEMEEAWAALVGDPDLHVTIDLFHFGIVFFRSEQVKEHFVLKW